MLTYVLRRVLAMVPMLIVISFICFVIIQLPPGDFLTTLQAIQGTSGGGMSNETADLLRSRYGLNEPFMGQYFKWISGFPRGDFGWSFEWATGVWEPDRRPHPLHGNAWRLLHSGHAHPGHSYRHLLGDAPILAK